MASSKGGGDLRNPPDDRRCTGIDKHGERCRNYAMKADPEQRCAGHAGINTRQARAAKARKQAMAAQEAATPGLYLDDAHRATVEARAKRERELAPPERLAVMIEHDLVWERSYYGPGIDPANDPNVFWDETGKQQFRWVPVKVVDQTAREIADRVLADAARRDRDWEQRTQRERARWKARRAELLAMGDYVDRAISKDPSLQQYLDSEEPLWLNGIDVDITAPEDEHGFTAEDHLVGSLVERWRERGGWANS